MGDFNCVRRSRERVGVGDIDYGRSEKDELNAFIEHMELEDVPLRAKSIIDSVGSKRMARCLTR